MLQRRSQPADIVRAQHQGTGLETTGAVNAFLAQLAEYKKAPEVTRKRLYLEAMEEILATVGSKIIIDESVRGVVPLLNLNQGAEIPARKEVP